MLLDLQVNSTMSLFSFCQPLFLMTFVVVGWRRFFLTSQFYSLLQCDATVDICDWECPTASSSPLPLLDSPLNYIDPLF